jgi:hypothetical protein
MKLNCSFINTNDGFKNTSTKPARIKARIVVEYTLKISLVSMLLLSSLARLIDEGLGSTCQSLCGGVISAFENSGLKSFIVFLN